MKKLIIFIALFFVAVGHFTHTNNDNTTRTIDLQGTKIQTLDQVKNKILKDYDSYEVLETENIISFQGESNQSIVSSNLSLDDNDYTQYVSASYNLETNNYFYSEQLYLDGEIVEQIEYNLTPEFTDNSHPDIVLTVDGMEYSLGDVFFESNELQNLCELSVLDNQGSTSDGGEYNECTQGGSGLIYLAIILLERVIDITTEIVVNAVTTTVILIQGFFQWVYDEVNLFGTTTISNESFTYNIPLDIEGDGVKDYEFEKVNATVLSSKQQDKIYLALVDYDGSAYVSLLPISLDAAKSILANPKVIPSIVIPSDPTVESLPLTLSTYTYESTLAYTIAGPQPVYHYNPYGGGTQFQHYHYAEGMHSHSLFGTPIFG